jgi:hypothetical protein
MTGTTHNRRSALGILATGPIALLPALAVMQCSQPARAEQSADGAILSAWRDRQAALEQIEKRGLYQSAETHSPALIERFDRAEMIVHEATATTLPGLLAKLWVAFSHQGTIACEADRAFHNAVLRADVAGVEAMLPQVDFDREAIFGVIKSLSQMMEA